MIIHKHNKSVQMSILAIGVLLIALIFLFTGAQSTAAQGDIVGCQLLE